MLTGQKKITQCNLKCYHPLSFLNLQYLELYNRLERKQSCVKKLHATMLEIVKAAKGQTAVVHLPDIITGENGSCRRGSH